jgi:uncharacterized protein (UPF0332 family)
MISDNLRALVRSRLEQADEALGAAQILLAQDSLRASVNRSYYAMFYAVLSLLALQRKETSKHSGAISLFDREFVLPGVFSKELSRALHYAFRQRLAADYAVSSTVQADEVRRLCNEAQTFIARDKEYLTQEGAL